MARVISAGLSPTNAQPAVGGQDEQALDDRIFLEHMYLAGARPFFDALGAHPYGFAYPPDDPPGAHGGLNFNRILDLRAAMEAYGDESKPVWATEVGWTTHGTGEHAWLTVTPQQQADYLARAWRKTGDELPWLKGFTVLCSTVFGFHQCRSHSPRLRVKCLLRKGADGGPVGSKKLASKEVRGEHADHQSYR